MINHKFYHKINKNIDLQSVLNLLDIATDNNFDPDLFITDINNISEAKISELCFLSSRIYLKNLKISKAKICLIDKSLLSEAKLFNPNIIYLPSDNVNYHLTKLINYFYNITIKPNFISERAVISDLASIGNNCYIDHNVVIGDNVTIGDNVVILANSYIGDNVTIGTNVTIGANSTITYSVIGDNVEIMHNVSIGQDGFGFAFNGKEYIKIEQLGLVIIADNVSIGSNCSIDRGSMNNTMIGEGTKIDNLVQIAHNVQIGKKALITAQVGMAGSSKIGDFTVFGGQTGVAGHIEIGSGNRFAAQSGVTKNIADYSGDFYGMPAQKKKDWQNEKITLKKLTKEYNKK
jgi:UDP-3-O-[3-hydroxymyristoyl] glucosamine N-acyltransferase